MERETSRTFITPGAKPPSVYSEPWLPFEMKIQTTILTRILILTFLIFASCKTTYLNKSPIPTSEMTVSKELEYIEHTDQADRKKGLLRILLFPNGKVARQIWTRDTIRAVRVDYFYSSGLLKTDNDKFTAGLILFHTAGYSDKTYAIFEDLEKNGQTDKIRERGAYWKKLVIKYSDNNY